MPISDELGKAVSNLMPVIEAMVRALGHVANDDIRQNVAMRLLSGKYSPELINRTGWLHRLVRSQVIDYHRAEQRINRRINRDLFFNNTGELCHLVGESEQSYKWQAPAVTADDMARYLIPTVREKLKLLSDPHREALILSVAGYSYAEIAELTDTPVGTVRSRVHYARRRAKELLAPII